MLMHFFLAMLLVQSDFAYPLRDWIDAFYHKLFRMFKNTNISSSNNTEETKNDMYGFPKDQNDNDTISLLTILECINEIAGRSKIHISARLATLAHIYARFDEILKVFLWYNLICGAMELDESPNQRPYWNDLILSAQKGMKNEFDMNEVIDIAELELTLWQNHSITIINSGNEKKNIKRRLPVEMQIIESIQSVRGLTNAEKFERFLLVTKSMKSIDALDDLIVKYRTHLTFWIQYRCDLWHKLLENVYECCNRLDNGNEFGPTAKRIIAMVSKEYAERIETWPKNVAIDLDVVYRFFSRKQRYLTDSICVAMVKQRRFLTDSRFIKFLHPFLQEQKADINPTWRDNLRDYCISTYLYSVDTLLQMFANYGLDWTRNPVYGGDPCISEVDLITGMHLLSGDSVIVNDSFATETARRMKFALTDVESVVCVHNFCLNLIENGHITACDVILQKCNEQKKLNILQNLHHANRHTVGILSRRIVLTYLKLRLFLFFICFVAYVCDCVFCDVLLFSSGLQVHLFCFVFFVWFAAGVI